ARRAGVERLTVYNHFPERGDLFAACQRHFLAAHPRPSLGPHPEREPETGLRSVLTDLYRWFRENAAMERHIHRDRAAVPELDALLESTADPALKATVEAWTG